MDDCANENIHIVNDASVVKISEDTRKRKRPALAELDLNADLSNRNNDDVKKTSVIGNNSRESPSKNKRCCNLVEENLNSSSGTTSIESRRPDSSGYVSEYSSSDDDFDDLSWFNLNAETSVYNDDILKNMMIWEDFGLVDFDYLDKHPELNADLRGDAVNWLVKTVDKMDYHPSTLFYAVSYLDRYLSVVRSVGPEGLTLVVAASLLLAAKMEETVTPGLTTMASVALGGPTVEEMGVAERRMISVLEYRLSLPTSFTFLMHIVASSPPQATTTVFLTLYILELSLVQGPPYIGIEPSLIACASLALARSCLGLAEPWSRCLMALTGYSPFAIHPVTILLYDTLATATTAFPVVSNKYSSTAFFCVATISPRKFHVQL